MQEFQIFLLESLFTMMLLLPGDVAADSFSVGWADTEWSIAFPSCKGVVVGLVMNPFRGNRLDVANHIGKASGGFEAKKEMAMIRHAADSLG